MNNGNKIIYEEPKVSIVRLDNADVITASGFSGEGDSLFSKAKIW